MQTSHETTRYEVHCERCHVTFPVGTKRCVHCGGRVGRHRSVSGVMNPAGGEIRMETSPAPEEDAESPRRSPFSPVALLWILLFAGGTIYRACAGS